MVRYQVEVLYMDSDEVASTLCSSQSQVEARHHCQRHAQRALEFRSRRPGIWKAQGVEYWYRITRQEASWRREVPLDSAAD